MATLLLSDLHLPRAPSPLRAAFARFLGGPARNAQAVYLLGDVFEYWVGDDIGLHDYAAEVAALRTLADHGVRLYFMHGNRDFLVGKTFAKATGVRLLPDPSRIEIEGRSMLLSHGDAWCTGDRSYQRWRRLARNRAAQWLFLHLPRAQRRAIAGGVRSHSGMAKRAKPEDIMDVDPTAVAAAFRAHGVTCIIHGHTHRPAIHHSAEGERIVLADWRPERMEYLVVAADGLRRELVS
ncbi:UDP-2,3-diacylglucosamine hydrolase [Fontimonas thermophila]|uniref:UDP-2,3-diacylglucosamine hydrolase n=2 Tax=Fontimonas thermophila TaxID=1076937 RepID=A0A1I2HQF4_9GAMM|nr:UDP-2,3-diacylglucosamine hydrolase [Fontimonas thermophila]